MGQFPNWKYVFREGVLELWLWPNKLLFPHFDSPHILNLTGWILRKTFDLLSVHCN